MLSNKPALNNKTFGFKDLSVLTNPRTPSGYYVQKLQSIPDITHHCWICFDSHFENRFRSKDDLHCYYNAIQVTQTYETILKSQTQYGCNRGTQRIVSVNYLFGRPLIPSDFLERIGTSNFRHMRNLMSVVFGLLKMSFWVPKKGQLSFSERR